MQGSAQNRKPIRATIRPEIELTPRTQGEIQSRTASRLTNLPAAKKYPNATASYENGAVVLRGSVATERDKKMMAKLMMLEPGVDSVRNELSVQARSLEQIPAVQSR